MSEREILIDDPEDVAEEDTDENGCICEFVCNGGFLVCYTCGGDLCVCHCGGDGGSCSGCDDPNCPLDDVGEDDVG